MTKFKLSSDLLIGQSSEIDAVFLPVHVDSEAEHSGHGLDNHWTNHHIHNSQEGDLLLPASSTDGSAGVSVEEKEEEEAAPSTVLMHAIITDTPDSSDWCYRVTLTSICVIVVVVSLLVFGHSYIRSVLAWLEQVDLGISISVIMLLFTFISFPVAWGLSLMMVTCGYLYGCLYGPLVVTLGVMVGLTISTPVMRSLCVNQLRSRFYSHKVEAIINVVSGPHGMKVVALTRLTPIPFGLQNALFTMSSMGLIRYLVCSVTGLVPMTVLNCYMGSTLRTMHDLMADDSNRMTGFFIFGGQILVTVILLWFVVRKARVELKKAMDESDKSSNAIPPVNGDCSHTVFVEDDGL